MLDLVTPLASEFICLTPFSDRALPAGDLADIITARGIRAEAFRSVSEGIAAGCGVDAPGSFIAWLSSVSPVYAMEMPGNRYDVGDLKSYEEVEKNYGGVRV